MPHLLWNRFVSSIQHSARGEAFNADATTYVTRADLIREMQRLSAENTSMRQTLEDYGLD